MKRLLEFFEKIILKILDKMNLIFVIFLLVIFGYFNQEQAREWFDMIGGMALKVLP